MKIQMYWTFREQYQELLTFIRNLEGSKEHLTGTSLLPNGINGILNRGASRHMTGNCQILEKTRRLSKPFSIPLPNGKVIWANSEEHILCMTNCESIKLGTK